MKKVLFTLALLIAVLPFTPLMAQNDSVIADTTQVDEIEAFSDTTSQDSAYIPPQFSDEDFPDMDEDVIFDNNAFRDMLGNGFMGMFFVLAVLIIVFVLFPIVVLGLILWFIYKNRKNRMHLAEMAMQNGQPIPNELMKELPTRNNGVREKGVRQVFLGIGLIFLLGWVAGKIGAGIGILVLCIGIGNLYIAKTSKEQNSNHYDTETLSV